MAQVYGCIECGMLFAGWEFCLSHIEHCRPQHYLEVDKNTLKEMCMIGHRKCLVPAYQPGMIEHGIENDGDEEQCIEDGEEISSGMSQYSSDGSAGETTFTQDFLNPVERNLRPKRAEDIESRQDSEQESEFDGQEQMVLQLFDSDQTPPTALGHDQGSNISRRSQQSRNSRRTPVAVSTTRTGGAGDEGDEITDSRTPKAANSNIESLKRKMQRIEKGIHQLIKEASPIAQDEPRMLLLEVLPKVYEVQFGTKLDFQKLGFPDIKSLLQAIPSVEVVLKTPYYNIEHEYLQLTDPSASSLLSWGEDYSDAEEESHTGEESHAEADDKYNPFSKGSALTAGKSSTSSDSMDAHHFSNQETPLHANRIEKPFSFTSMTHSTDESFTLQPVTEQSHFGSSSAGTKPSHDQQEFQIGDDVSISTGISSCGSSRSVILALAEMLPNTNAYNALVRVLSKHPQGITIGKLMLQAPEFKNFLSHCTDRRCEAQIKLAHTVLQQCQGISHARAAGGSILYFQAPKQQAPTPTSIMTRISREEPLGGLMTSTGSIDEKAAKLFAASEFITPATSPRHTMNGTKDLFSTPTDSIQMQAHSMDDAFRRPARLDTISSPLQATPSSPLPPRSRPHSPRQAHSWSNPPATSRGRAPSPASSKQQSPVTPGWMNTPSTPRASSGASPASSRAQSPVTPLWLNPPSTPKGSGPSLTNSKVQSPSTPMSREQTIAESAARILAHAQSMTTPPTENKHYVSPVMTPSPRMRTYPEGTARMLSLAQNESVNISPNSRKNLEYRGDSRMYFFTDEMSPTPPGESSLSSEDRAASPMTVDTGAGSGPGSSSAQSTSGASATKSYTSSQSSKSVKRAPKAKTVKDPRGDLIEKIALDMFPTTNMHYKLLLALAENPNGLTWAEIDSLIPRFLPFVEKHGTEQGVQDLDPCVVLESCVSIMRKKDRDSDLFFINAPKMMPSRSIARNSGEDTSVTSTMSESSSSVYGSTQVQGPSALSLSFEGSDTAAILFFLGRVKEDFKGRIWPTSWEQICKYFVCLDKECKDARENNLAMFYSWISLFEGGTQEPRSSKQKKALSNVLHQLQRLKCLTWQVNDIVWHERAVAAVVMKHSIKSKREQNKIGFRHGDIPISYIETMDQLEKAKEADPFCSAPDRAEEPRMVSIICEGTPNQLHFILVGTEAVTYIFDCVKLNAKTVCEVFVGIFANKTIVKAIHDVHSSLSSLATAGGFSGAFKGVFDTQLAMEALTGVPSMAPNQIQRQLGLEPIPSSHPLVKAMTANKNLLGQRPISSDILSFAADRLDLHTMTVKSLLSIFHKGRPGQPELWNAIEAASDLRAARAVANNGGRQVCFDIANGYALASEELIMSCRPADAHVSERPSVSDNVQSLFKLLPAGIVKKTPDEQLKAQLSRISLNQGRPATAWLGSERIQLGRVVTAHDILSVTIELEGDLGHCDTAGVSGQLHRVAAFRNQKRDIIGLTMHVARHVTGAATMIMDLLFFDPTRSILFLGESGSGKTTVLRDAARILSDKVNVSVVDTHNEIAGCCGTAHASVGNASRVMINQRDEQCHEIISCVHSQRPHTIVVDELDSKADIGAAYYCKRRSIQLLAAAVGTVEDLLNDSSRSLLLGGVKDVNGVGKTRASEPLFDVIVDLRRGVYNEWRVIDAADAVDACLRGKPYQAQVRTRDPETGELLLAYEQLY